MGVSSSEEKDHIANVHSAEPRDDSKASELSSEFVGRWSTLISTTNWEKGRIICQWREALMGSQTAPGAYSDEAWSRQVGGVSPQHVGRLRRVFERFGDQYGSYKGIYWSHFLAALEWDDAEMYLEGSAQSNWSVSQMRRVRWEALGGDPASKPKDSDPVNSSHDDDDTPLTEIDGDTRAQDGPRSTAEGPRPDGPDFGDEYDPRFSTGFSPDDGKALPWEEESSIEASPFAQLPSLPVDVADAMEQFKLAIIRHRATSWSEVSQHDVVKALDALRSFTLRE